MNDVMVTGGAGFIGSHLARRLAERGDRVRVLDNFSTGKRDNLADITDRVEVIEGDLRDLETVRRAARGVRWILHQGALASVPRSLADPVACNDVNVGGTLNVLIAAKEESVDRVVFASSSSVYGNSEKSPKHEDDPTDPLSPYAVSKRVGEMYGGVFHGLFGVPFTAIRYFNVFGPYQDEKSAYAAVIPIFIRSLLAGERPTIFGDGTQSRDFTFISNVVDANLLALERPDAVGRILNVACGGSYDLNHLVTVLNRLLGTDHEPVYEEPRAGDVKHSRADIERARRLLGYEPKAGFEEGLERTLDWYRRKIAAEEESFSTGRGKNRSE
ncbi:MAG: SDR family oxidoreductase [Candidatus Eisenbacteria bacterium]|nr:SDR family oxidoreductase [Candidatus Eisenbacteria bacterium]